MHVPFTDEHQPSKKARVAATVAHDAISTSSRVATQVRGRGRGIRGRGTGGRGQRGRGDANVAVRLIDVPSLASTTQKNSYRRNFPLGHKTRLRGVVQCMECTKPRCIYSAVSIGSMQPTGVFTPQEQVECRYAIVLYISIYRHFFFLVLVYEIMNGSFDTVGTLRNKHWRMPWSQQFICVECKPWVRGALAMTYSRLNLTSHALT